MNTVFKILITILVPSLINAQTKLQEKQPLNHKDTIPKISNGNRIGHKFVDIRRQSSLISKGKEILPSNNIVPLGQEGASEAKMEPVVLPSPNSTILTNLISEDVDLYTGKASVNLPLYTLQCNSISLPISIQTSINAHKVNDIGSWIGLGWNLNAGGAITRVMKNLPDEFTGTISSDFSIPGYGYLELKSSSAGNVDLANFDNLGLDTRRFIVHRGNWAIKNNLPDWGLDLQPDDFFFSFGSYSGKFIFDQDGNVHVIPKTNLKITPIIEFLNNHKTISGFIVITDNGFKYEFGNYNFNAVEESKLITTSKSILYTYRAKQLIDYPYNSSGPYYMVAQDSYNYDYYVYDRTPYLIGDYALTHNPGPGQSQYANGLYNFDRPEMIDNTQYCNYSSTWLLTKITAPTNEWISFNYVDNGLITYQSNRTFSANLPDIIDMRIPPSTGLTYGFSYFISPLPPVDDPGRMIMKYPAHQTFTVTYSNIELKSKKLASIITSQNNSISFLADIPRVDFPNDYNLNSMTVLNSQNQILKKVKFTYQSETCNDPIESFKFHYRRAMHHYNTGGNYIGMGPTWIETLITPENEIRTFSVEEYNKRRTFLLSVQEESNGVNMPPYLFEYDNSAQLPFRTSLEQDKFGFANVNSTKYPFETSTYTVKFPFYSNTSGNVPFQPDNFPVTYFHTDVNSNSWPLRNLQANKAATLSRLKAGVLKKITYPTGGYKEFSFDYNGNATAWNGLKVTEINEYESPIATPIKKTYTFGTFVPNDNSIGKYYLPEGVTTYAGTPVIFTNRVFLNSDRTNAENTTKGANGGYTWAEVGQLNNGKVRSEFWTGVEYPNINNTVYNISSYFTPNIQALGYPFPFPLPNAPDWKRGLIKGEYVYVNNETTPSKSTSYTYDLAGSSYGISNVVGMATSKYNVIDPSLIGSPWQWSWLSFGKTTYTSVWSTLISKTERIREQAGSNYTEIIQDYSYRKYTYNNTDYLFQYQQKNLRNSRNEQTISYSKFPLDYNLANTNDPYIQGMAYLLSKNILNAKVEQFSYKQDQNGNNKKYIGGLLNKYHPDKPLPKEIFKLKTNGLLSTFTESNTNTGSFNFDPHYNSEVNFPLYDANGRILEQNKANDIKESYIWDYNKAYPVAKTVNATNNDIAFSSFEADEEGANMSINAASIITDPAGAFTGRKYYNLTYPSTWFPPQPITVNINNPGKEYRLNFWYRMPNNPQPYVPPIVVHTWGGNVETMTPFATTIKSRNGWHYCEYIIPASYTGALTIIKGYSEDVTYIDEIRFYPGQSQMTTYTFDPLIGMTSETDVNGKTTYYEYDALNRLAYVKNEDKDIVKTICYNYAGQPTPCVVNIDPCSSTPRPVINSVTKTGSSGSNFIYSLDFTPSPNSTSCVLELTDITDQTVTLIPISCTSPATFQIPKFHQFSIVVISYTSVCPGGIRSLPYP